MGYEPRRNAMELFAEGKVDAFLAFPPEPQELRARKIGRAILNTTTDKPWSQYFCCMLYGNGSSSALIQSRPSASCVPYSRPPTSARPSRSGPRDSGRSWVHRAIRLRAADADEVPYDRWREFDPEDSMRFYALRLHEVGMIKSSPNKLIAEGTDWRFLNELKRELKA